MLLINPPQPEINESGRLLLQKIQTRINEADEEGHNNY